MVIDKKKVGPSLAQNLYPSLSYTSLNPVVWSEELCRKIEARFMEEDKKKCLTLPQSIDSRDMLPLYKYRSFDLSHPERTETTITDARLWSPSIEALNDPLEAGVVLEKSNNDKWSTLAISMFYKSPWCGCICFSYDPVCTQMWAHYACNHEGYILKYERTSNFLLRSTSCKPVKYRRKLPIFDILNKPENAEDVLFTKSEAWEYEKEVRLSYPRTNSYTAAGLLKPSGVIYGLRTPKKVKNLINEIASNLKIGQIVCGKNPYSLEVEWHE